MHAPGVVPATISGMLDKVSGAPTCAGGCGNTPRIKVMTPSSLQEEGSTPYQHIHVLQKPHSVWEVLVGIKADKAAVCRPAIAQRKAIALLDDVIHVQDLPQPLPLNECNLQHKATVW